MTSPERQVEEELVAKLRDLKYEHRPDIRDRHQSRHQHISRNIPLTLPVALQIEWVIANDSICYQSPAHH